jgi:hypothetical protein
MACNQPNYEVQALGGPRPSVLPASAFYDGERVLIVCDAPGRVPQRDDLTTLPLYEHVFQPGSQAPGDPDQTGPTHTLYKCVVPLIGGVPKKFRIFMCHDSRYAFLNYIALAGSVSTGTATVSACTGNQGTGICLAKAQLFHTLDVFTLQDASLDENEKAIRVFDLPSNTILNAVVEFTITSTENCTFLFRECIGVNGVTGVWTDPVADEAFVTANGKRTVHCRGWWPSSAIIVDGGSLDVTPPIQIPPGGTGPHREVSVFDKNGDDTNLFNKQASDVHGTTDGNKGGYGVNIRHNFTVSNSSPTPVPTYVHFAARRTGEAWFGAAQIVQPSAYIARGVPAIFYPDVNHANNAVNLTTTTGGVLGISVPAGATNLQVSVNSASGSGSALPVNLLLTGGYAGTGGSGSED